MLKSKKIEAGLIQLLDYLWHDEKKHYLESPKRDHIYLTLRNLAKEIKYKPNF